MISIDEKVQPCYDSPPFATSPGERTVESRAAARRSSENLNDLRALARLLAMSRRRVVVPIMLSLISACSKSPTPPATNPSGSNQSQLSTPAPPFIPTDPELIAANNRGVGLMGKFEYEPARAVFQQLVEKHPNWHEAHVNLAIATLNRQREGDEQAALDILNQVLKSDPANLRAHYCSALLKLYLQSPDEAITHFQLVAEADSKDAYAAYYVGQCMAQQRHYEQAITWFDKAIKLDPYLRSGYYAASQANRAAGRNDDAQRMLEEFQKLEKNPRAHQVKFIYTLMGSRGEAKAVDLPATAMKPPVKPEGPIFLDPVPLLENGDQYKWSVPKENPDRAVSITACDIKGDGLIDVFIANVLDQDDLHNAVCINQGDGKFKLDMEHILGKIPNVNAALWGDFDNDGLTDVYLCRRGPNMLWRQGEKEQWVDVTASTGVANGEFDTVDGAMFDADHDGDLDIFCVNANGPNELFNNNLDGTFRPIAQEKGIAGNGKGSRQVLPVDLDGDRDLDIVVVNSVPPHDVWLNDRLWQYHAAQGMDQLCNTKMTGLVATCTSDGQLNWHHHTNVQPLVAIDARGDGIEVEVRAEKGGWILGDSSYWATQQSPISWNEIVLDANEGYSIIAISQDGQSFLWRPGPGRHSFAALTFTGRKEGESMRSNASGIGTHFAARIDSNWVIGDTLRNSSGPGQSQQPIAIGLGGHSQIDFVSIDWSDGVFQSEVDLKAGQLHKITETQRQLSSCPVLFAWNGRKYEFVTDFLGVGGIGYATGSGEYAPSRPWENLLLPQHQLQPKDNRYVLKLGEPMEEVCYLDAARLVAYDLPPNWQMTIDDRMSVMGPEPTGHPRVFSTERVADRAVNDRGQAVTELIRIADLQAAPVGEIDSRFIGRLTHDHVLTLTFDVAIPQASESTGIVPLLVIDGWIEYPYSQTMFAAWQAKAEYRAPTIEAQGEDGMWHVVLEQFGYPAGMPRQMSVPLLDLPTETTKLRISTNQEVYWDRIALVMAAERPTVVKRELNLVHAQLIQSGFAKRTTGPQRQPHYDYDHRAPFWDTRYQRGMYTQVGPCMELVEKKDDALAIFGPGEEIHLEFDAALPDPLPGWTRRFVLETEGWCKDMDLSTKDGETVEPLPFSGDAINAVRDQLHQRFNTRFESGR